MAEKRAVSIYAYDSWAVEPVPVAENAPADVSATSIRREVYARALATPYPRCSVCRRAMLASLEVHGEFGCPEGHRTVQMPVAPTWRDRLWQRKPKEVTS